VPDRNRGLRGLTLERIIQVTGGSYLNFAVLQGGSLEDAIAHRNQTKVSYGSKLLNY
jgi:autonomous glycyl radical cofactor GrcA